MRSAVSPANASLAVGSLGLLLAVLTTLPALKSVVRRLFCPRTRGDESNHCKGAVHYCDQDGEATAESRAAFSDKWHRVVITLLAVAGLGVALSLAVIETVHGLHGYTLGVWLLSGVWVSSKPPVLLGQKWRPSYCRAWLSSCTNIVQALLSLQAVVVLCVEPSPTRRFSLAQFIAGASILAAAVPWVEIYLPFLGETRPSPSLIAMRLYTAQSGIATLCIAVCAWLPRRPDVYTAGQVVDREYTVSLLARHSFSWVDGLLRRTGRNQVVEVDDLPQLPHRLRSETLCANLDSSMAPKRKLWRTLVLAHRDSVVLQLALTLINAVLSFGPQVVLYQILSSLEARSGDAPRWGSAIWVLVFGGQLLLSSAVEQWLFWVIYSRIGIPIYEELTAVIFDKAMRQKDVKTAPARKETSEPEGEGAENMAGRSSRSVINLATVDARRIADFASFGYLLPSSALKLSVACILLIRLLGWRSLACGLGSFGLLMPVNLFVCRRYSQSQKGLMAHRDQKMAVVTEILRGIRQVKLSAMEGEYQSRISTARQAELRALWRSFLYNIGLSCLWIFGPLVLSTVSLAAYSILHDELSASVAFTAMSVFGSLELTLSILPEMVSSGLEAKISCDRIETYLATTPEKKAFATPDQNITLKDASVSWASSPGEARDGQRFVLRDLNLSFPRKGLSIIAGKTGSGKSLLLASILGECDLLSGTMTVPEPASGPPDENWIVDGAMAYVAQVPWVENASVRDNILFGLPYSAVRYRQVLFACALEKDLDMFDDGDRMEIGAGGVNLSGGQRWRISLARALYSRAGVLILDDIFSALDTHTGEHVYRNALIGPLGAGRTRILATHHASLCLGQADYSVVLDNTGIKYAGPVDESFRNVADIPSPDEVPAEDCHQPPSPARSRQNSASSDGPTALPAKAFTQEETRGKGSLRLSLWAKYFRLGGSIPWWLLALSGYVGYVLLYFGRVGFPSFSTSSSI